MARRPDQIAAWESHFEELVRFHQRHGHTRVRPSHKNPRLASWVVWQRMAWKKGQLTRDQKRRLSALDFDLDPRANIWEQRFSEVVAHRRKHGAWPLDRPGPLRTWLVHQRYRAQNGQMTAEHARRLAAIGFDLDPLENSWERHYAKLVAFYRQHGHCNVSRDTDRQLSGWLDGQRHAHRKGQLSPERWSRLKRVGFQAQPRRENWEAMFAQLAAHHRKHGNLEQLSPELRAWLSAQHKRERHRTIRGEERRRLKALGGLELLPSALEVQELRFAQLADFKKLAGHTLVPLGWKKHPGLAIWVRNQRGRWGLGTLDAGTRARLEAMGFVHHANDAQWEREFARLSDFHRRHGHTEVTRTDSRLFYWAHRQRKYFRTGKLPPERKKRLERLGFRFNFEKDSYRGEPWEPWFEKLKALGKERGKPLPPVGHPLRRFAEWCRRHKPLPPGLPEKLASIGFSLNPWEDNWNDHLDRVKDFHQSRGHFPSATEPGAGPWLYTQRRQWEAGKLPREKENRLRAIGYDFMPGTLPGADPMLQALEAFKARHGHLAVPAHREHTHLAAWMELQRKLFRRGTIRRATTLKLDRLGFPWTASEIRWERELAQLLERRGKMNSARESASPTASWLARQRERMKRGELTPDQERRLLKVAAR